MPVERSDCDDCGHTRDVCPECGERFVTPLDNPPKDKPNKRARYGPYGTEVYTHVCWKCDWSEDIRVTIERVDDD